MGKLHWRPDRVKANGIITSRKGEIERESKKKVTHWGNETRNEFKRVS